MMIEALLAPSILRKHSPRTQHLLSTVAEVLQSAIAENMGINSLRSVERQSHVTLDTPELAEEAARAKGEKRKQG